MHAPQPSEPATEKEGETADPVGSGPPTSVGEKVMRWVIPLVGLVVAGLLVVLSLVIAPPSGAQGFQPVAEISKVCLTLAGTLIAAAIVSFLISEYWRKSDRVRDHAERVRVQHEADALERRRLVGELRDVHHAVTTATLRIRAHRTVRTYGEEIRTVVMPTIARLGGVIGDVNAQTGSLFPTQEAKAVTTSVGEATTYLENLTKEFENGYLSASLLQELDYAWRKHRVDKLVKSDEFAQAAPTVDDLSDQGVDGVWAGHLAHREPDGTYTFPRLAILLELPGSTAEPDSHQTRFSTPIRCAMTTIENGKRA